MSRSQRIESGNFGDVKVIDNQISEIRFTFGGGIRIYYTMINKQVLILITGGNKSTQQQDINKTKMIVDQLET